MSDKTAEPYLMLTPIGTLRAYAQAEPDEVSMALQTLMAAAEAPLRSAWLEHSGMDLTFLTVALAEGWVHEVTQPLRAPDANLDNYLPHAIAGLSGSRTAALASNDGFCLARVGYSQTEAEALCAAAAEFADFVQRQRQRGWSGSARAVSFHNDIDMLLPTTTLLMFWVDGTGYWLIIGDEPLINNIAFVQLVWGLRAANARFSAVSMDA